ncbi:MAG: hypothetical protein JNL36_03190 [Candidatus Kapabacteria bacterium]|nr:hypothetical protein [Candidatus Kapabacteria bacterium]
MHKSLFIILALLFGTTKSFSTNETNNNRYYPLNVGDSWEYFLGDSVQKSTLKFTIISLDTIQGQPFAKTKQEWLQNDSLTYTQEYLQTVDYGFVITAVNKTVPMFQIQHPSDGSVKFTEKIAKKFSLSLSEDQLEHLRSFRASFTFVDFESGTHSMWEFRNKKEVSKFAENVGMVYLKNDKVQMTLKFATVKGKMYRLL